MSRTIDERIVEMRFDNKQFESGVKESLGTLDKLKAALNLGGSAKSFQQLDKAANNVSLAGIASSVEALQNRFSTLGIIGMRVIENLTDSLMNMASRTAGYVSDAIISGGLKRAQNIENAHFQLQALLKDEAAVQAVMDNAMASVDGTAYAYDEAAKAASQFAATGMRAGEEMESALRGITGVAAMTNSEYESISQIFTTVAGNGRLMGDQLLQLSSRGLNAAATVADYFREVQGLTEITESDIREMVSSGEISFQAFAAAMDWAFGESAFRANETFTGALSNMRSSLARIGAGFFSPLIEQNSDLVLVINTMRERINDVKSALVFDEQKSAISGLTEATNISTEALTEMFKEIDTNGSVSSANLKKLTDNGVDATKTLTNYINGVTDGSIRATYATKTALSELTGDLEVNEEQVRKFVEDGKIDLNTFTSAMEHTYGNQRNLSKQFTDSVLDMAKSISEYLKAVDLTKPMDVLYNVVDGIKNLFVGLYSILQPLGSALSETFGVSIDDVLSFSEKLVDLTSRMRLSEKGGKDLHDAFKGILDILNLLADGFIFLLRAILPVGGPITSLGSGFLSLAGSVGRALSSFSEWIRTTPIIAKAYQTISDGILTISSGISSFIDKLAIFISSFKELKVAQDLTASFTNVIDIFSDVLDRAKERFSSFGGVFGIFRAMIQAVGPIVISIINGIGSAISTMTNALSGAFSGVHFNSVMDLLNGLLLLSVSGGIQNFFKNLTGSFEGVTGAFKGFTNIVDNINRALGTVTGTLNTFQTTLKATTLRSLATSIAILAASLLVISMIDSEKLTKSLGAVTALMGEMFASMAGYERVLGNTKLAFTRITVGMIGMAVSILILASALKKISLIDSEKLMGSLGAITVLLGEMTAVAIALSRYGSRIKTGAVGIIAFSAAIYILTSSVKKLGELDVVTLRNGLTSISLLIGELAAFMAAAKFGKFKTSQAVAIIGLSSALLILQKAVESFGGLDTNILIKGLLAVTGLLTEISIFSIASGESKHILSTAASLLIMAYALEVLEGPMGVFGSMSTSEIAKGLVAIGIALAEITIALNLMPKHILTISIGLLAVAEAIGIISDSLRGIGSMSIEEIAKGLVALGGSMLILSKAMNSMKGTLGASSSMLVMAVALRIFTPVIKVFGEMKISEIAKGLIALAGGFAVVGVAGLLLGPITPAILALSAAMTLLGIACAAVGAGILAFSIGMTTMAAAGVAQATAFVGVIRILIKGVLDAVADSAASLANAVKTIVLVICDVIRECAPTIVETVLVVVKEVLTALAENAPEIVHELLMFIVGVINALTEDLPEVLTAIGNFLSTLVSFIIDAIKNLDPNIFADALKCVGIMAALMIAFAGLSTLAPAAMLGLLEMGVVIGELAGVLAAIGALSLIPGLNWLVGKGGELLQGIGTAIGQFIGGIVGGVLSGVTAKFPKIGQDLSDFMTNVKPFLEGASNIDTRMLQGVKSLVEAVILLTGAEILNGVASFLLGGSDFDDFSEQIVSFGEGIAKFSEKVKNINPSVVTAASYCAKALAELYSNMPKQNGWMQKITGQQKTLGEFAEELIPFGEALVSYSNAVAGKIDQGAVEASIKAAEVLKAFNDGLPDMGGLKQLIFGHQKTLAEFAEELKPFGEAMVSYSATVAGKIDKEAFESSEAAARCLASLYDALGEDSGIFGKLFGGEKGLDDFGKELKKLGTGLVTYSTVVAGIDYDAMDAALDELYKLIDLATAVDAANIESLTGFSNAFTSAGNSGISSFIQAFKDSEPQAKAAVNTLIQVSTNELNTSSNLIVNSAKIKGAQVVTELAKGITGAKSTATSGISTVCSSVIKELTNDLPASKFSTTGANSIQSLANGIASKKTNVGASVSSVCTNAINTMTTSLPNSTFNIIGQNTMNATSNGVYSGQPSVVNAMTSVANAATNAASNNLTYSNFYWIGSYAADGLGQGITDKIGSIGTAATNAAVAAINAAKAALDEHSPSKVFYEIGQYVSVGFANGIDDYSYAVANSGEQLAYQAVDPVRKAIKKLSESIEGEDSNYDPVITPVIDISSAEDAINWIYQSFQDLDPTVTSRMASMAARDFDDSYIGIRKQLASNDRIESKLDAALNNQGEAGSMENYNTFYITSSDPKQAAEEVGYIMQRQVERGKAVWGG